MNLANAYFQINKWFGGLKISNSKSKGSKVFSLNRRNIVRKRKDLDDFSIAYEENIDSYLLNPQSQASEPNPRHRRFLSTGNIIDFKKTPAAVCD